MVSFFSVLIKLNTGEIIPMEARLSVYVEEVPVQVHIEPLNERMSQTEPIVLDASKSIDYSNPTQDYLFTWNCEVVGFCSVIKIYHLSEYNYDRYKQ